MRPFLIFLPAYIIPCACPAWSGPYFFSSFGFSRILTLQGRPASCSWKMIVEGLLYWKRVKTWHQVQRNISCKHQEQHVSYLASTKTCNALRLRLVVLACARLTRCFVICPVGVHTRPNDRCFLKHQSGIRERRLNAVFVNRLL